MQAPATREDSTCKFAPGVMVPHINPSNKRAFVTNPDACRGCRLCVEVCPERAIKLKRRGSAL